MKILRTGNSTGKRKVGVKREGDIDNQEVIRHRVARGNESAQSRASTKNSRTRGTKRDTLGGRKITSEEGHYSGGRTSGEEGVTSESGGLNVLNKNSSRG